MADATIRVRLVQPAAHLSAPALVAFPAGAPPAALLGGGGAHALAFAYSRGAGARAARRRLVAESDVLTLEARNFGAAAGGGAGAFT